jgi:hypothetical protein
LHSLIIIAGFFLMLLLPCAFAIFSSRDPEDSRQAGFKPLRSSRSSSSQVTRPNPSKLASWRIPRPSTFGGDYDLVLEANGTAPAHGEIIQQPASATAPTYTQPAVAKRSSASNSLLGIAEEAEARSVAAQVYAAQASKSAAAAMARAAAARAAAATALAVEAERAVAEAHRMADAVRRAYETAPPSVGPTNHHLPETHPSMDFPRSHVIRRAA